MTQTGLNPQSAPNTIVSLNPIKLKHAELEWRFSSTLLNPDLNTLKHQKLSYSRLPWVCVGPEYVLEEREEEEEDEEVVENALATLLVELRDLIEATRDYDSLKNVLDYDIEHDTVRKPGSLSRNLRRVRQGLDLIRALFEQFLSTEDCSLREAASTAYAQVCAPFHSWAVRTAAYAGMYALPTREQLLQKLNETDISVEKGMRRYIDASVPVIQYIDKLYIDRKISLDW
ncbi:hypothetical protein Sjap_015037 [Stephania japonica]|uniref:Glycolipid transfer protein domain-containing protein n=1 Tax=Stephania japonica TaxID=461633 RepID=A0AAP0IIU4_9MAGN